MNANANQGYNLGGLILNVAGKVTANYWLSHVYPNAAGQAHRDGDIHIHDLDMLSGYCAGWLLRQLLTEGFNGVPGKVEANPPKHMSAAIGQIVNFLGTVQNEWAGAQAFSSFDTYMAPFIRRDAMPYAEVKQCMQELVYNLNVPSRWGTQTPFTNLTFDWACPQDLREKIPYIGGEEMPFNYGDLQAAMAACEAVDTGLGRVLEALDKAGGAMIVTADHGNCETMIDPETGGPHTAHTLNPVPVILVNGPEGAALRDGRLADLAPSLLQLMNLPQPEEMTGESLIQ